MRYLATTKFPRWPGAKSALEEAEGLLRAAAEIEHALLVQYLFAGYSLDPSEIVLRQSFIDVARQEMAHLMTVNNLLLLLGKGTHFHRDRLLPGSAFDPLPFALVPPSLPRLADIVATEAPDLDDLEKASPQMATRLRTALAHRTTQGDVNRVGALYAVIEWLFTDRQGLALEPDLPQWSLTDSDFKQDAKFFEAETRWQMGYDKVFVDPAVDRGTALAAIRRISQQGESFEPSEVDSHFELFLQAFERVLNSPPALLPIVRHPSTSAPPSTNQDIEAGRITDPKTKAWAQVANKRYQMLLVLLPIHLSIRADDQGPTGRLRNAAVAWAFQEMLFGLRDTASNFLATMPISTGSTVMAGLPFELDQVDLTGDLRALITTFSKLQQECEALIQGLLKANPPLRQKVHLGELQKRDEARRQIINEIMSS
jgi:Ferritin-like